MPLKEQPASGAQERLDVWVDGAAVCLIAVGSHGDPLDLGEQEVEALIQRLQDCLRMARGETPGT
ncbi:hypothetical protein SAMN05444679_1395 [Variovorax sp. CF079]|nr:hypothetical protein SAMN05444679_1395 [Variovorax sp. CF079]